MVVASAGEAGAEALGVVVVAGVAAGADHASVIPQARSACRDLLERHYRLSQPNATRHGHKPLRALRNLGMIDLAPELTKPAREVIRQGVR